MMKNLILLLSLISFHANAAEYIIKQKSFSTKSLKSFQGMSILDTHEAGNLVKVKLDERNQAEILSELHQDPSIEYVVKNFKLKTFSNPLTESDMKGLREQWANQKVNLEKAWQLAGNKGSKDIVIAVIDTGVDYRHESLSTNMIKGYDFANNDNDPMDETMAGRNPGHGTHCTGSIAGNGLVENGVVGAVPNISIMPIRFLKADGSGDLMAGIKSIDYAIENKAHIISASWGATVGRQQAMPLVEAVERADKAGVIFVAAAANDGKNNDSTEVYPANAGFPNTISVAASDSSDQKPQWSNYGKKTVHISSPGLNIMSTLPQNAYGNLSGTSMATPLVAGIVGLLKAQNPALTGAEVRALLQTTGAKVSIETACNCRVDAAAAVEALKQEKMYLVPTAASIELNGTMQVSVRNGKAPFQFSSSNESVLSVAQDGTVTGKAEGIAQVSVKDATGNTVQSLDFLVAQKSSGGGGGDCPLGDPALCQLLCAIQPTLPWCN